MQCIVNHTTQQCAHTFRIHKISVRRIFLGLYCQTYQIDSTVNTAHSQLHSALQYMNTQQLQSNYRTMQQNLANLHFKLSQAAQRAPGH